MGGISEKDVELCPSAKVLYEAIKNVATERDSEDLSFIVGAHRTVVRVLDGQATTPAVKDARRKAEDAFAACLRAYGDRLLGSDGEANEGECGDPA